MSELREKISKYLELENKKLNEKEKKELIEDIKKIRSLLYDEINKMESAEKARLEKETLEERKKFIGKYFKIKKGAKSESYSNVLAFKILEIVEDSGHTSARCLTLCDGYQNTCWVEVGILNQVMSLWLPDKFRMMYSVGDTRTIDLFKEIGEEEFNELKNNLLSKAELFVEGTKLKG